MVIRTGHASMGLGLQGSLGHAGALSARWRQCPPAARHFKAPLHSFQAGTGGMSGPLARGALSLLQTPSDHTPSLT